MYLWNARRLALALRAGRVTEAEKVRYLIAGTVFAGISARPGLAAWGSLAGAAQAAVALLVSLGGIAVCYRANRSGDGRAFLDRFICLMAPVYVRWLALYYGVWFGLLLVAQAAGAKALLAAFGRWYVLLMLPVFYWMLHAYVAFAARGDGVTEEVARRDVNAPSARGSE